MSERRATSNTNRQCARFGCSANAVATFTFDSEARIVWLDTPLDGNARAGELCSRHARALTPPRGWKLEDRRPRRTQSASASNSGSEPAVQSPPRARSQSSAKASTHSPAQSLFESGAADGAPAETRPANVEAAAARQLAAGPSGTGIEAELRGLLNAHSPLLARAFRSSGTV